MNKRTLLALVLLTSFAGKIFASEATVGAVVEAASEIVATSPEVVSDIATEVVAKAPAFYARALSYVSSADNKYAVAFAAIHFAAIAYAGYKVCTAKKAEKAN